MKTPTKIGRYQTPTAEFWVDVVFGLTTDAIQEFPLTFEPTGPAITLGVRQGLVVLGAQQCHSGGCLVSETTVKGGARDRRFRIDFQ